MITLEHPIKCKLLSFRKARENYYNLGEDSNFNKEKGTIVSLTEEDWKRIPKSFILKGEIHQPNFRLPFIYPYWIPIVCLNKKAREEIAKCLKDQS